MTRWKVGELAARTGLTVRTLHHYDRVGLLSPSERTAAGYRLYGPGEVARLQQIVSLRQLGLSLEEIGRCLAGPGGTLRGVVRLHARRLREELEAKRRLCERLEALARRLDAAEAVSAEEILTTIEATTMFEKYFTPEQLAEIEARGEAYGEERLKRSQVDWADLIAAVRSEMEKGTDPTSEPVRALARRWQALIDEFTGGDRAVERSVATMYQQEPGMQERFGLDPELFAYVGRAMRANTGG